MSILSRFSDLITVNIHAVLERAEDPEKMLAHLLRAMEANLAEARLLAANAIAAERGLRRELGRTQTAAEHWKEQARLALAQGREDLARRALAHKLDHYGMAATLEAEHREARQVSAEVNAGLAILEKRLAEARHRQALLLARLWAARVQLNVDRSFRGDVADVASRLNRLEQRLEERENDWLAQIEVSRRDGDLEAELSNLEQIRRIEEELKTLKEEME